jgi:hypothetical protein
MTHLLNELAPNALNSVATCLISRVSRAYIRIYKLIINIAKRHLRHNRHRNSGLRVASALQKECNSANYSVRAAAERLEHRVRVRFAPRLLQDPPVQHDDSVAASARGTIVVGTQQRTTATLEGCTSN